MSDTASAPYYDVALPIPRSAPLTYAWDGPALLPGMRVLVPLGRRIITGTIVRTNAQPIDQARMIVEVLDTEPSLPTSVVELTRWMAEYYLCSWGEAIDAAVPTGLKPSSVFYAEITTEGLAADTRAMAKVAPRRAALLEYLIHHHGPQRIEHLQRQLESTSIAQQLESLQSSGYITVTTELERERGPRTVRALQLSSHAQQHDHLVRDAFDELDRRAPKQSMALGHLYAQHHRGEPPSPATILAAQLGVTTSVFDSLVAKGLAEWVDVVARRDDLPWDATLAPRDEAALPLTNEQQQAVAALISVLDAPQDRFRPFLLDGVTGSGKTVVYQRAMSHCLALGRTCLMMVPEIALTPQLHDRFRAVFGDTVALLHSRMSMGERIDTWRRVRSGACRIVLGPRSAVFAPLHNVGLIIVDEEHEPSYKQDDPSPRYHGRDVAVMRARLEGCPIVLGSATPSMESYVNADEGRYTLLRLTHRADHASLPTVQVIDMRTERKTNRTIGTVSVSLVDDIKHRLTRREGTILFLNRRGYASSLVCDDCGAVPHCPHCDVSLTYHKVSATVACHYCGYREQAITSCRTCGGLEIREQGIGTQRIEEDVRKALEGTGAVIERMDADTTQRRGSHRRLLQRFANGDVDVLIGTQMVAKGLDIPHVTLIGVINADQSLFQTDFRAVERTAQLLVQVSGRAGRDAERPGEVLIQTSSPEHPLYQEVARVGAPYRSDVLLNDQAQRREHDYPPYARFIIVECSGPLESDVEHAIRIWDRLLPNEDACWKRFPPITPSVARIRNRYRRVIVIKNLKASDPSGVRCRSLLVAAQEAYFQSHAVRTVRVTIDVDASGSI